MTTVTAKEIAALLNISPAAVSLALNGKPGVGEATRAQVLETAKKLGYTKPGLINDIPAKTICFVRYAGSIIKIAENTTFASFVLQGAEARASELGYGMSVRYLNEGDMYSPQTLGSIRNADGIIFLGTDITDTQLPELEKLFESLGSTPIVVVDSTLLSARTDCVVNDCFGGAKTAVASLIKAGHKKIAYVRSRQRIRNFEERELGARAALEAAGMSLAVTVDVDISSEGAFQDFDRWIKGPHPAFDAIFAENDVLAAAVMRALNKHGFRIPDEVSVIGFDDIPICEMLDPPLTTVRLFKEDLGMHAVDLLHRRITRGDVPHQSTTIGLVKAVLSTRLVPRYSVKPRRSLNHLL